MPYESRKAMRKAEQNQQSLHKELELDRYLRVDEDPFPSKRVFKLLKNVDLETVSFNNVQNAGNPMYIEKLNRQELFDLCLVNFARLCVVQEWDGLLSSGGGGGGVFNQTPILTDASYDTWDISATAPWGTVRKSTDTVDDEPCFHPFIAPTTGTISAITIAVTSAASSTNVLKLGLYNSDTDTGLPTTKIASCEIDLESTGDIRQTAFTGSMDTTRNQSYYMAYCRSTSYGATIRTAEQTYSPGPGPTDTTEDVKSGLELQSSNNTLPSTVDGDDLQSTNTETPVMLTEW